jgi:hypothetical protein
LYTNIVLWLLAVLGIVESIALLCFAAYLESNRRTDALRAAAVAEAIARRRKEAEEAKRYYVEPADGFIVVWAGEPRDGDSPPWWFPTEGQALAYCDQQSRVRYRLTRLDDGRRGSAKTFS